MKVLSAEGFCRLLRRGRTLLLIVLAVPLVLVVRVMRPLVLVRFGRLRSGRFGHFAIDTELYLCGRDAGLHPRRAFDLFYHSSFVSNRQLQKMWDRTLRVSRLASLLDRVNRWIPGGDHHVIPLGSRDVTGVFACAKAHLSFTLDEDSLGRQGLREIGIPDGKEYVCFHARDSAYQEAIYPNKTSPNPYHDTTVKNYLPAAEELARRGYYALRMGAVVKRPIPTTNGMIIDYATRGRSDFLDIFLSATCRFFLGSGTGLFNVALIFRRPVALANFIPLEFVPTWSSDVLFIPKKLWLRAERRFLTFREILGSGAGRAMRYPHDQLGIEVVENTPEEITALAVEMDERLKGTWKTTEEDEELQRRFWSLWKPSELNRIFVSRIDAEFLRQNRELLE